MIILNSECLRDCKKFLGVFPYNNSNNVVQGDGHYLYSLYDKYGKMIVETTLTYLRGNNYEE